MTILSQAGILPGDERGDAIQAPSGFQNRDAETSPNESPLTVTVADKLVPPENATHVRLRPTGADLLVGDNTTLDNTSPAAGQGCYIVPANTEIRLPVCRGQDVNVKAASGTCTLYFIFEEINAS